jgi:PPIC-type PPIASE domain
MGPRIRALLREPLLHFLAIGAALFLLFEWKGQETGRVVLTRGQIEHLRSGFTSGSNRPPTDQELDELIEEYVREELAVREAQALGLDRDDTLVRQRLRQKLEFVGESAEPSVPTEAELQAWLTSHTDRYRQGPRFTFRQVGFRTGSGGSADAEAQARRLLSRLVVAGAAAPLDGLGDLKMLPAEVDLAPRSEVERLFGTVFADALAALPPGRWSGPVESSFGLHVVLVTQREEEREPALQDVRGAVQRELLAERKVLQLNAMYRELRERYRVVIEKEAR